MQNQLADAAGRPAIEKVPTAARRMAVSVSQVYREVRAGRLKLIKMGARASGLDSAEVDAWIRLKITTAAARGPK